MLLALLVLVSSSLFGQYEVSKQCFQAPESLGNVKLFYCDVDKSFALQTNDKIHTIQKAFMDKELRGMDAKTLQKFLGAGYLSLNKMDNNEFSMKAKVRGLGGGPITAGILYWVTKSVCYGGAAVAVGGATVATGGAIIGAAGAVGGAGGAALAGAGIAKVGLVAGGTTLGTAMASGGATVAAGAIATSGIATEIATMGTISTIVTSGGCMAAAMAQVEAASMGAAAFGLWLPLP